MTPKKIGEKQLIFRKGKTPTTHVFGVEEVGEKCEQINNNNTYQLNLKEAFGLEKTSLRNGQVHLTNNFHMKIVVETWD